MYITIVVPIYNEHENAKALCIDFLNSSFESTDLLLVDNGSDAPAAITSLSSLDSQKIKTLRLESNLGFGGGIKAGLMATNSEWIVWMPGNMKVLPSNLNQYIGLLTESNATAVVKACRKGRKFLPKAKTLLASMIQSIASLSLMLDTGATPTAIHRGNKMYDLIASGPIDYTFESYVVFLARKLRVPMIRTPVIYGERLRGQSHWQRGLITEIALMMRILQGFSGWAKLAKNHKLGRQLND